MKIEFVKVVHGPDRLVAEAELVFEEGEPLAGIKLVGFALWRSEDAVYCTVPSRAFGLGAERRYHDYLRGADGTSQAVKDLKAKILMAWQRQEQS